MLDWPVICITALHFLGGRLYWAGGSGGQPWSFGKSNLSTFRGFVLSASDSRCRALSLLSWCDLKTRGGRFTTLDTHI